MKLKPSAYNVFLNVDDKDYAFNTFRCELAEIDQSVKYSLQNARLDNINDDDIKDLIEAGFIVPIDINEPENYFRMFNEKKREKKLSIKFLLATFCNACCTYCYQAQGNYKSEIIDSRNLEIFIKWLSNEIEANEIKDIDIELFGGEPLLAGSLIPELYERLGEIGSKYQVDLTTAIITNATLLTDDLIRVFLDNNVEIKMTLDGIGKVHNDRRRLKDPSKDGYRIVLNNIKKIKQAGGIDLINIRMNVDKLNINEVEALASELNGLGITKFYCGRVFFRGIETDYDKNLFSDLDYDKEIDLKLYYTFRKYGFANSPSNLDAKFSCQFFNKYGYVVSPSLKVAKCDELIDLPEFQIGYINHNGKLIRTNNNYMRQTSASPADYEQCRQCKLLPLCAGGCPIISLNKKGTVYTNSCSITEESVKFKIANILKTIED